MARRGREVGQFEALLEMPDRGFGIVSFHFAQPEHGERVRRAGAGAVAERDLELRDRLVEKPHLLVRDAEIVMGLHVFRPYQLLHLGAELPQHLVRRNLERLEHVAVERLILFLLREPHFRRELGRQLGREIVVLRAPVCRATP